MTEQLKQPNMSIAKAAKLLDVSEMTLRNWGNRGKLVPDEITEGGHRRYSIKQLEEFAGHRLKPIDIVISSKGIESLIGHMADINLINADSIALIMENIYSKKLSSLLIHTLQLVDNKKHQALMNILIELDKAGVVNIVTLDIEDFEKFMEWVNMDKEVEKFVLKII